VPSPAPAVLCPVPPRSGGGWRGRRSRFPPSLRGEARPRREEGAGGVPSPWGLHPPASGGPFPQAGARRSARPMAGAEFGTRDPQSEPALPTSLIPVREMGGMLLSGCTGRRCRRVEGVGVTHGFFLSAFITSLQGPASETVSWHEKCSSDTDLAQRVMSPDRRNPQLGSRRPAWL